MEELYSNFPRLIYKKKINLVTEGGLKGWRREIRGGQACCLCLSIMLLVPGLIRHS